VTRPAVSASQGAGRITTFALWVLVAVLGARFTVRCVTFATRPSSGFVAYFTASRLLCAGPEPSRFYDDAVFATAVRRITPGVFDIFNVNPPTTSLLMLPFAGLGYPQARIAWTLLSLASVAATCLFLLRESGLRGAWLAASIALVLTFQPLAANLAQGQAYGVLLGLLAVAWYGFRRRRDIPLGVALGLAGVLKTMGGLLWLLLLFERRWRSLAWAAATVLAVALASLPWLGVDAWRTYLGHLPELASRPTIAVTAYQSLPGLLRHLLTLDVQWSPNPLTAAPRLAALLGMALAAAMIALPLYTALPKDERDLSFAGFVFAGLALTPYSMDYHYTLALLPIFALLPWVREQRRFLVWVVFIVAVVLIGADFPYRSPRLAAGALALLAYPKLAGACLLWGLVVWGSWRSSSAAKTDNEPGDRRGAPCA
jgi:hypothetical protein